jgi:hypothetical protein
MTNLEKTRKHALVARIARLSDEYEKQDSLTEALKCLGGIEALLGVLDTIFDIRITRQQACSAQFHRMAKRSRRAAKRPGRKAITKG